MKLKKLTTVAIAFGIAAGGVAFTAQSASADSTAQAPVAANSTSGTNFGFIIKGQKFLAGGSGQVSFGHDPRNLSCTRWSNQLGDTTADGVTTSRGGCTATYSKYEAQAKLPSAPVGSLIARIGDGPWFYVGTGGEFTADRAGNLILAVNDSVYGDNSGSLLGSVFIAH